MADENNQQAGSPDGAPQQDAQPQGNMGQGNAGGYQGGGRGRGGPGGGRGGPGGNRGGGPGGCGDAALG